MAMLDVIEYGGDNSTLVWKHPREDFNTMSKLIVNESQEALLYLNGQALDLFPAGQHTLHTQNIPLLSRLINLPTGGVSPFRCQVYFINKVEMMSIKWGVGDIDFRDPTINNYRFKIGAHGEMSIKASDSRKLVIKLVGAEALLNKETISEYFEAFITMHVKQMLPRILVENRVSIYDVESMLSEMSEILKSRLFQEMIDYGVDLKKFWISGIMKPEDDVLYTSVNVLQGQAVTIANEGQLNIMKEQYERQRAIIEHLGEAEKQRIDAQTEAYRLAALNTTHERERIFDVYGQLAENPGTGVANMVGGAAIGLGVGNQLSRGMMAMGNSVGLFGQGNANGMYSPNMTDVQNRSGSVPETINLKSDSSNIPGVVNLNATSNENVSQGSVSESSEDGFKEKIRKLVIMKEEGLLSDEEFERKRQEILNSI